MHILLLYLVYYSAQAAITIPQIGWLKQQKFIFSQFWRLKSEIKVLPEIVSGEASFLGL